MMCTLQHSDYGLVTLSNAKQLMAAHELFGILALLHHLTWLRHLAQA